MPITVSFDLENYAANHHSRLLSMFERFGWQSIGGTSFRYPRLGTEQPVEDWFNHVVPALMLLRAYAVRYPGRISRFSIDAQSMSGCEPNSGYGNLPSNSALMTLYDPGVGRRHFGEQQLKDWLDNVPYPY